MGRRSHHNSHRQKPRRAAASAPPLRTLPDPSQRKAPVTYGKPFIVMEDLQKQTFIYHGGQWVPHEKSIAECKLDCQVKQLAQKINGMTRYEVCAPLEA